ncbi:hypothetical protein [Mesorhizobium sp. M0306]|uniref:hypothetical protein n=1 Tax=unclassified Mesorhizobium TaxID=325217 RepID=UPI00333689E9
MRHLDGERRHQHFAEPRVPIVGFGEFATDAELALAANWDRTPSSLKRITFIALKTTEA